jgi:glycine/D-amino acid oxidase-like deaminating enzyme
VAFSRRGCVNSSLLAERLVEKLLDEFPGRLQVYENSAVADISYGEEVVVRSTGGKVTCGNAVLCTNGYAASPIKGSEEMRCTAVQGMVACMLGYFDPQREAPAVLTHLPPREGYYFYLTRRATEQGDLVCVGGPERKLKQGERFEHRPDLVPGGREEIHHFLRDALPGYVHREDHPFFWSGLMGYTSSGLRLVGPHPEEARLLLNLGCNGVGILPSVAAARRIAAHLGGEDPPPSLFEPGRQRPQ